MHDSSSAQSNPDTKPGLRRNLSVWEAIGVSIALMAPAMASNANPQGTASVVGRAVPLSFTLATASALLIAYSFVRLSQRFNHAGSVYGYVGASIGPRAGIFSGWLLAAAYVFFAIYTAIAAGRFTADELQVSGVWSSVPQSTAFVIAALALAIVWYFATRPARGGTRIMLAVEGITVLLILVVAATVLYRVSTHSAPHGQTFDLSSFAMPSGSDLSSIFLGTVFGFLSFAGFEGAATLGEETANPRRDVPRAILGTVIFGGLFFIVVTAIQVMGFGTDASGIHTFVNSPSLMGDLGSAYIGHWIGHVITIGAALSAAGCSLACIAGSSRLVFAMSRDGAGPKSLAHVSPTHRIPARAVGALIVGSLVFIAAGGALFHADPFTVAVDAGTAGTLVLLVAYFMTNIGSAKLLFFSGRHQVSRWEIVMPALGAVVLGYTMFRNVYPFPSGSAWWGPGLFLGIVAVTAIGIASRPAVARRAGELLTRDEGLAPSQIHDTESAADDAPPVLRTDLSQSP
ncbi:APC family permease [Streptomyces sp. NPDC001617]